jgi:transcription antitermination protein NusB
VKNKFDPRHLERLKTVQELFAQSYNPHHLLSASTQEILKHLTQIDQIITLNAPKWPLDKINRVDLSILRLAIYELQFQPQTPYKVVIDEAIELAKDLGADTSSSFINGVLGSAVKISHPDHDLA